MKRNLACLMMIPALLFAVGVTAQTAKKAKTVVENPLKPVPVSSATISGTIFKNNEGGILQFDFTLGDTNCYYSVKGSTRTISKWSTDVLEYAPVRVEKNLKTPDGRLLTESLKNTGVMTAVYGQRKLENMILANMKVTGSFLHGRFDDGLWFSGLSVEGVNSAGVLDYSAYNGHYTPTSDCSFGDCRIGSRPGKVALNYDNSLFTATNVFDVAMEFGDLILNGKINFSDVTKTNEIPSTDSKGNSRSTTVTTVTATTGLMNLDIARKTGATFLLSAPNASPTADDILFRKLIAFLQLMTYDLFAE